MLVRFSEYRVTGSETTDIVESVRPRHMTCTPCTQDIRECGDDRQGVRYLHVQAIAWWDFSGMRINGADLINEAALRTGSL